MIEIKFKIEEKRSVALDDEKIIGECNYFENGNIWNIVHTFVSDSYQGQGIAKKLVLEILKEAKNNKKELIADCSYAAKILNSK